MMEHGFLKDSTHEQVPDVVFARNDIVIIVTYYPEDFPNYTPMISIGKNDPARHLRLLGLWSIIPEDDKDRDYRNLVFSSEIECERSIKQISHVISRFAFPLCDDQERLEQALVEQEGSITEAYIEDKLSQRKEEAYKAFKARDYSAAVNAFESIPLVKLSKLEQEQLEYARNHQ